VQTQANEQTAWFSEWPFVLLPGYIRSAMTREYWCQTLWNWQLTDRFGDKSLRDMMMMIMMIHQCQMTRCFIYLCETGATMAALQAPAAASGGDDKDADNDVSGVGRWLTVDVTTAAMAVPATARLAESAIVSLLAPLTTSDSVLLSTTDESPTAAAFDCHSYSHTLTW